MWWVIGVLIFLIIILFCICISNTADIADSKFKSPNLLDEHIYEARKEFNYEIDTLKKEIEAQRIEEKTLSKKLKAIMEYLDINLHENCRSEYVKPALLKITTEMKAVKIHRCKTCKQEIKS